MQFNALKQCQSALKKYFTSNLWFIVIHNTIFQNFIFICKNIFTPTFFKITKQYITTASANRGQVLRETG